MKIMLAYLFAVLWILDTFLTIAGVRAHGLEAELNPLMRALLAQGEMHFIICKMAVLALVLCLGRHISTFIWLCLCCIMWLVVLSWGLILLNPSLTIS